MKKLLAPVLAAGLLAGAAIPAEAAKKKDVRAGMSQEQKAELKKRGKALCAKKYAVGNVDVVRVEILSDGSLRCWLRG